MSKRTATPEQIAKAKERRAKVRDIAKQIAAMTPEAQTALVQNWPTTIEGHALSLKNACLLAYQGRATVVGGFRQWKKAGRFVRKGEGGMSIWIPLMKKTKDANGDEINEDGERPNFGLATVFDISQTDEGNCTPEEINDAPTETARDAGEIPAFVAHHTEQQPSFAPAVVELTEGRTILNSDGTDGPCLICPPPENLKLAKGRTLETAELPF